MTLLWVYIFKDLFVPAQTDVSGARGDLKGRKK